VTVQGSIIETDAGGFTLDMGGNPDSIPLADARSSVSNPPGSNSRR